MWGVEMQQILSYTSPSCKSHSFVRPTDVVSEYFTWRYTKDHFHLYVPLSPPSKFLSSDLDV